MSRRTPIAFDFTAINAAMERLHSPGGRDAIPARAVSVTFKIEGTTMLRDALEASAQKHAASIAQSLHGAVTRSAEDLYEVSPAPFPILPGEPERRRVAVGRITGLGWRRWIGAGPDDPVYQFGGAKFDGVEAVRYRGVEQPEFRHRMTGLMSGPQGHVLLRCGGGEVVWNGLVEIVLAPTR